MQAIHLKQALKQLRYGINRHAMLPILQCVRIYPDSMVTSDLGLTVEVKGSFGVHAVVPFQLLSLLVNSFDKNTDVSFEIEDPENKELIVRSGGSFWPTKTELKCQAVDDWPVSVERTVEAWSLKGSLIKTLKEIAVAASNDDHRRVLTGINVEIKDGCIFLTTTDSYRLFIQEVEAPEGLPEVTFLLNPDAVNALPDDDSELLLSFEKDWSGKPQIVGLEQSGIVVTSRVVEGEFPNWRELVPAEKKFKTFVKFGEHEALSSGLGIVKALGTKANNLPVKLPFKPGRPKLTAELAVPDSFELEVELRADVQGEEILVALNPKFFEEAICFAGGSLKICDGLQPLLISGEKEGRKALLMPVRLS